MGGLFDKLIEITGKIHSTPLLSRAPGRIEVLGNHTDYNGGLVLAATINRYIWALGVNSEKTVIHSVDFSDTISFDSNNIDPSVSHNWGKYVKGLFWALGKRNYNFKGLTAVITGDVPIGSGLSSSAALEVALVNLIIELNKIDIDPRTRAILAFEAERLYCKIACGVMDQFTSQLGQMNSLLGIDCASLITTNVPFNPNLKMLVVDSMVSRSASDVLNQRRQECQEATRVLNEAGWKIKVLSEINENQLDKACRELNESLARRLTHIVHENARVKRAITFLQKEEFRKFGKQMYESHESSRDFYEVSHPKLDLLVDIARTLQGVIGSRMTGAGFGGAVLCVVKAALVDEIAKNISHDYERETGQKPTMILCEIPGGVKVQELQTAHT